MGCKSGLHTESPVRIMTTGGLVGKWIMTIWQGTTIAMLVLQVLLNIRTAQHLRYLREVRERAETEEGL